MYIGALHDPRYSEIAFMDKLVAGGEKLKATRPTAVNLRSAVKRQLEAIQDIEGNAEKFHNYLIFKTF